MTEKRFKYTFKGIEDTLETNEEYKYTSCDKDGFQDLCEMLNELADENEQLKQRIKEYEEPNCRKCMEYSQDGVGDYCMSEKGLLGSAWTMFPYKWDYTNAKDCKEYEE